MIFTPLHGLEAIPLGKAAFKTNIWVAAFEWKGVTAEEKETWCTTHEDVQHLRPVELFNSWFRVVLFENYFSSRCFYWHKDFFFPRRWFSLILFLGLLDHVDGLKKSCFS